MKNSVSSINPFSGQVIASYPVFDDQQVATAFSCVSETYATWKFASFETRAVALRQIAAALRTEKEHLAHLATSEMGKPIAQSRDEVEKCARTLDFYADRGAEYLAIRPAATEATKSYVSFRPLGTVLAVMPWNFPYWQVFRAFAPIVMAGNVMVLKHASNVTGCALAIEKVICDAVAPLHLLKTVIVPGEGAEKLIAHPSVAAVTFTGSTDAGKKVAAMAGSHIKKCVLELGGSDAYIILEDADLDLATDLCVKGRLVNSGQSCVAAKRFVVMNAVLQEFENLLTKKMQQATMGDPTNTANRIGPMARHNLRDELHRQVSESVRAGAKLLCGGYIPDGDGALYPPTVLTNVSEGMPAYSEELFGPVASVIAAGTEEAAISIANDTRFGLGGGIFSRDTAKAQAIAEHLLDAGNCFVNDTVHSNPELPFGGIKESGYGRELGVYGITEFVNIKTVFVK
jgi:succinate-semialdehyde dehydrogenase / glutarate-semialdehyde dehydrogenase